MDSRPGHARPPRPDLTAGERNAIWEHATRTAADATAQIRNLAGTNPAAAADAAWATSDALHVAAAMLGSRILPRPPTPTTAPRVHRTVVSRRRPRWGTGSGRPPG